MREEKVAIPTVPVCVRAELESVEKDARRKVARSIIIIAVAARPHNKQHARVISIAVDC